MQERLQVKMLGGFSIRLGDHVIDDSNNRTKKVWLVLAYLIYSRNTPSSPTDCLDLMQNGNEDTYDPTGRLKTTLYRVRTLLNQLESTAGHRWIHHTGSSYVWDPEISLELDVERFEELCLHVKAFPLFSSGVFETILCRFEFNAVEQQNSLLAGLYGCGIFHTQGKNTVAGLGVVAMAQGKACIIKHFLCIFFYIFLARGEAERSKSC